MSDNERLSAKQHAAIRELLDKPTTRAAAKAAGVSEATIWRWLADPEFDRAYRAARTSLLENALSRLQAVSGDAVKTLSAVMRNRKTPAASRVRAAVAILEMSLKAKTELENEQRLAAIETALGISSGRKRA